MRPMIVLTLTALLVAAPALGEEAKPRDAGGAAQQGTTVKSGKSNSSERAAAPPAGAGQPQDQGGGAEPGAAKVKGSKSNTSE